MGIDNEPLGIIPSDFLKSTDPKMAADLISRVQVAWNMVEKMKTAGHESVCAASTIAFTHYGVVGNFNFSEGITTKDLEDFAPKVGEYAREKYEINDFHDEKPFEKNDLKKYLNGMHSAWLAFIPSIVGRGHTIGLVPGRFNGEFVV